MLTHFIDTTACRFCFRLGYKLFTRVKDAGIDPVFVSERDRETERQRDGGRG